MLMSISCIKPIATELLYVTISCNYIMYKPIATELLHVTMNGMDDFG